MIHFIDDLCECESYRLRFDMKKFNETNEHNADNISANPTQVDTYYLYVIFYRFIIFFLIFFFI